MTFGKKESTFICRHVYVPYRGNLDMAEWEIVSEVTSPHVVTSYRIIIAYSILEILPNRVFHLFHRVFQYYGITSNMSLFIPYRIYMKVYSSY